MQEHKNRLSAFMNMARRMKPGMLTVFVLFLAGAFPARAAEIGRYVRIDAMTPYVRIAEIEVYSGGTNILRGHPEFVTGGLEASWYYKWPVAAREKARLITDGSTSTVAQITVPYPTLSNVHVDMDFGRERKLEAVVWQAPNEGKKVWPADDEGWRVVSVLDSQRRVVSSRLVTVFTPECLAAKGVMRVELSGKTGPFVGRAVAPGSQGWFTLAEFMTGFLGVKEETSAEEPGQAVHFAEFARRNDPDPLAAFAREFFAELDLFRPGMEEVRAQVQAGKLTEALDSYKRRLFDKFAYLDCVIPFAEKGNSEEFKPDPLSGVLMQGEDQFNYRVVDRKTRKITIRKPGDGLIFTVVPWKIFNLDMHPRGLLRHYAVTGEAKYLARWAEMMDEWAIFYQRWADAGEHRDFWPHHRSQAFMRMCKDLREAARFRPELVDKLPAATLARVFKVISEENPAAYWRLARKTVFNHQFNAWSGAYYDSRMLEDFYVGQRLQMEMELHFQRLWTLVMTRDGSMIEVGDYGHIGAPAFINSTYMQMKEDKPAWLTPELDRWFLHAYRNHARHLVRPIPPTGIDVREGVSAFGRIAALILRQPWSLDHAWSLDFVTKSWGERIGGTPILSEPDVRAIIDTVYGRGRTRAELTPARQENYDLTTLALPGGYQGLPQTVSDYMPYAGIHYLRRGWAADDSFIEMLCQPAPGSASTMWLVEHEDSGAIWDTGLYYWDFSEPLLMALPLLIDGQNQCHNFENKLFQPGSKTNRLTEAPEKPLPNRFHCSPLYDYQECFYAGAYQNWTANPIAANVSSRKQLKITGPAITGVRTTRQIFQLRKERLFVVVDRIRFSDTQLHQVAARYTMLPNDKNVVVDTNSETGIIRLAKSTGAQLTIRQFGAPGFKFGPLPPADKRQRLETVWSAQGETVLVSLLEPRRDDAALKTLTEVKALQGDDKVGFIATTRDGETIHFNVPVRLPQTAADANPLPEQALLAVKDGSIWTGLALGNGTVELEGRKIELASSDAEFAVSAKDTQPAVTPIYRPIDPPTVLPSQSVFVDKLSVSIVSQTPGVEIRYTTDGSEPDINSPVYKGPFEITKSCIVQARALRPGLKALPFAINGTQVSDISFARFEKKPPKPAAEPAGGTKPGLAYDYIEGGWQKLFAAADRLPATSSGTTGKFMDVSMRQTDSTFAVRYRGYINVPADGVYIFHAPPEYTHCKTPEPGYDLRVFVDGEEWRPGMMWHGFGDWSVPLAKGLHRFMVTFADARAKDLENQRIDYWCAYPSPWVVWRGEKPTLEISGPGLAKQPIPAGMLYY